MLIDFSSEIMEARKKSTVCFLELKKTFRSEQEINRFSNKEKPRKVVFSERMSKVRS